MSPGEVPGEATDLKRPAESGVRLLGPARIRELAAELDLRPTKALGQNFVHDANTVRRIVAAAGVGPEEVVLEVGPGLGSLTLGLLETGCSVVAVEIDEALAERLPATLREHAPADADRVRVVRADALALPPLTDPQPTALVANLPYNIAVPVVLTLFQQLPTIRRSLVMVQSEVAARLAAPPGSRVYGAPSVKAAWYADVRLSMTVSRSIFWPVPHVDSALVSLIAHEPPARGIGSAEVFTVIDAAFAQRRKMLRSALSGWAGSSALATEILTSAGIEPTARGETLTLAQYVSIALAGREHRTTRSA